MIHFNFKIQLYLRAVFCTLLCYSAAFTSSAQLDPIKLEMSSKPARIDSINNGFANLQNRRIQGDSIAEKLFKTMPYSNILQKEELIKGYNSELLLGLQVQKLAEAAGLEKNKHTSIDSLATALRAEQYAFGGHDSNSNSNGTGGVSIVFANTSNNAAALTRTSDAPVSSSRRRLIEVLREQERRIKELEKRSGIETIGAIATSRTGDIEIDTLLAPYHLLLKKLEERAEKYLKVKRDTERMQALYDGAFKLGKMVTKNESGFKGKVETVEVYILEDESLELVLPFMEEASGLVAHYGKKIVFQGIEEKMRSANSEERMAILMDMFLNSYMAPISDRYAELEDTEFLSGSLQLTKAFETNFNELKRLGLIEDRHFTPITTILLKDRGALLVKIRENDEQTYREYMKFLASEVEKIQKVMDFSRTPITLMLFQSPMAFFLLSKRSANINVVPFTIIDRVVTEIEYLTTDQKKALFAYLYHISFNFPAESQEYLRNTLLSITPITPQDVADLIEDVKKHLKCDTVKKDFNPSSTDRDDRTGFSLRVTNLKSGETRRRAIVDGLSSEKSTLKGMLNGITQDKIATYVSRQDSTSSAQSSVISRIQEHWILIMDPNNPSQCELDDLLRYKETLSQLKKDLDKPENRMLLTSMAVFKIGGASTTDDTNAASLADALISIATSTSSASKGKKQVLTGHNTGFLATIATAHTVPLALSKIAVTTNSNVPLAPSMEIPLAPPPLTDVPLAPQLTDTPNAPPPPLNSGNTSNSSGSNVVLDSKALAKKAAEEKAAALAATQLLEITGLEAQLEAKKATLSQNIYDEIREKLEAAKVDANSSKAMFAGMKIKSIQKALK